MTDRLAGATIVFDLDGTIADTAPDLIVAANAAFASEGFPEASQEAIKRGVGYGTKAMLSSGLAATGAQASHEQMDRMAATLVAYYEDRICEGTKLFPGFTDAALALLKNDCILAVCTNKIERLASKLLKALGVANLFAAVAGGDTFGYHKPDPRHITQLIAKAGGRVDHAVMVGDSEADVAAAKAAAVPVIAVAFGYATGSVQALGADAILHQYRDLVSTLPPLLKLGPGKTKL